MADTLARFVSQTGGQTATLLDLAVVDDTAGATRQAYVASAVEALEGLPPARLAVSGNQLVLTGDDLLRGVLDGGKEQRWPEGVLAAQRIAIGGSRGALARFVRADGNGDIEVFTTRPDTIFGATFLAVSPSHPAAQLATPAQWEAFRAECDRLSGDPNAKVGVPLGLSVENPLDPDLLLPVWLGNFIVDGYGTGAAGGCPACDQRDLDFARRYDLPVASIVCPPGMDPASYQVGESAYSGSDGTIINSGFLSGLPVEQAIKAATARLAETGRGRPYVQYRRRPLVVAQEVPAGDADVHRLDRPWRFTDAFLTAAALVRPAATQRRPHVLHVTAAETTTRHLLDARILLRALDDGQETARREPWEEILLVGDVLTPSGAAAADIPALGGDAARLAILADSPPDRELEWNDKRLATAVKFVDGIQDLPGSTAAGQGIDRATLAGKVAKAAASLEGSLQRRRTNTAVAAAREIARTATETGGSTGLDPGARALVGSLLYAVLPGLAERMLATTGSTTDSPPTWPELAEQGASADLVEILVQINGKKRGTVQMERDADEQKVLAAVRAVESLNAHLGEKPIRKSIVVPNRLVNIIV